MDEDVLDLIRAKCEQYWNEPIEAPETHAVLSCINSWAAQAERDRERLEEIIRRVKLVPLGPFSNEQDAIDNAARLREALAAAPEKNDG